LVTALQAYTKKASAAIIGRFQMNFIKEI
jgi:hypothetical protein